MSEQQHTSERLPVPHPVSGIIDCRGDSSFGSLVEAAEQAGWSTDGIQPEREDATVAHLLERRQPRPSHWGGGLLVDRCCRMTARGTDGLEYASVSAPRKASGPDLAFLFFGGEGVFGSIEHASIALVRPAPRYLEASGSFEAAKDLFTAAQAVTLMDPLSTRRIDWLDKTLSVWIPVRAASRDPIRRHLTDVGLAVRLSSGVPTTARFLSAEPSSPRLHLSASYDTVAGVLAQAEAERGRKRLEIGLHHLDSHGNHAVVSTSKAGIELLESLYDAILDADDFDDVFLREHGGGVRSAATRLTSIGEGGQS